MTCYFYKFRGLILGRGFVPVPSSFADKSLGLGVRELKIQSLGFGVRELKIRTKNDLSSQICKELFAIFFKVLINH